MTSDEMDQIIARCPGGTMSELSAIHRGPASVDIMCTRMVATEESVKRSSTLVAQFRKAGGVWHMVAGPERIVSYPDVHAEIEERYRRILDGETITAETPPLAPRIVGLNAWIPSADVAPFGVDRTAAGPPLSGISPAVPASDVDQLLERALDLVGVELGTMAVEAAAGGLDHTSGGKLSNYVRVLGRLVDDRHRRAPKKEGEESMRDLLDKAREIVKRHESGGV